MKNNKIKVALLFLGFFLLALLQIHFIWLNYDDYGYASLSYLPAYTGPKGMMRGLSDVFSFLYYHYQYWGGRVLWFFFEIITLKISVHAYRIIQAILTTGIFYMLYKIVAKTTKIDHWKVALASILCFGLVDIMVLRDTFYWFTASVLYLWPILPVFLLIYFFMDKERRRLVNILCIFLAFLASWSQEQVSIYIVSYLGLMTLHRFFIEKERNKWDIAITISALVGFAILMLAPGSSARMDYDKWFYSLSIFGKTLKNLPEIIHLNFGNSTRIFMLLFFGTSLYTLYQSRESFQRKWLIDIGLMNAILIFMFSFTEANGYFRMLYEIRHFSILIKLISFVQLIYLLFILFLCFYKKKEYSLSFLIISASLSQAAMIMAPYFPMRSATMLEFTTYILFVYVFATSFKKKKNHLTLLLIPLSILSVYYYSIHTIGYYHNNSIKKENDQLLREASRKIKAGEKIEEVVLKRVNEFYGVVEPEGVYYYMKYYYDIPQEVNVYYEEE